MESTAQSLVKTFSFYYMSLIYPHSLTTVEVQGSVDHQGTLMEQCTLVVYKLLNRGVFLIVHRTASFFDKKTNKNSDINNETAPCCTTATNSNNS